MERLVRTVIEAARNVSSWRISRFFATSVILTTACGLPPTEGIPTIIIRQANGAVAVPATQRVRIYNATDLAICTGRADPPDFSNPQDVYRFMSQVSLQGGLVPSHQSRSEEGEGTVVSWGPC